MKFAPARAHGQVLRQMREGACRCSADGVDGVAGEGFAEDELDDAFEDRPPVEDGVDCPSPTTVVPPEAANPTRAATPSARATMAAMMTALRVVCDCSYMVSPAVSRDRVPRWCRYEPPPGAGWTHFSRNFRGKRKMPLRAWERGVSGSGRHSRVSGLHSCSFRQATRGELTAVPRKGQLQPLQTRTG